MWSWPRTLSGGPSRLAAMPPVNRRRVAHRQTDPGPLQAYDSRWADAFTRVRDLVTGAVGSDHPLAHVGSTAVPGMIAKPVIDADLLVPDLPDEGAWLPQLEAVGFRLILRDLIAGDPQRQLTLGDPNTNLHVWQPGAVEPQRHRLFVEWLRSHPDDREATVRRSCMPCTLAKACATTTRRPRSSTTFTNESSRQIRTTPTTRIHGRECAGHPAPRAPRGHQSPIHMDPNLVPVSEFDELCRDPRTKCIVLRTEDGGWLAPTSGGRTATRVGFGGLVVPIRTAARRARARTRQRCRVPRG